MMLNLNSFYRRQFNTIVFKTKPLVSLTHNLTTFRMNYSDRIRELARAVPAKLVDFDEPRDFARTPTQASSNFITNKEQGDWAENLVQRAINETAKNHVAVKYGKSDDVIAGDEGFGTFYQDFQTELDTIGKRPDLLIFKRSDFDTAKGSDISRLPHYELTDYVKKAIAGIEVRSSAFLIDKYEAVMTERTSRFCTLALNLKDKILADYDDLLQHQNRRNYIEILQNINTETISVINFKIPGWRSTERLCSLNEDLKTLKDAIKVIQRRDFLSITPKVEDIKVVFKWIETFNVSHFYFQVFFDKVYGISFEQILKTISNPDNEGPIFSIEENSKNQNKTTFHIASKTGTQIAYKVDEPAHRSVRKEMNRGRLLFYVTFEGGTAYLDIENLHHILNIGENDF